jgi:hypothetical protein
LEELVRDAEQFLLSAEVGDKVSLWEWNESMFASLINSLFGRA